MLLTRSDLYYGRVVYHRALRNADGSALRARISGKVKTWKTRPDDFRVPAKHGLRESFYIVNTSSKSKGGYYRNGELPLSQWCAYDWTYYLRHKDSTIRAIAECIRKGDTDDTTFCALYDLLLERGQLCDF